MTDFPGLAEFAKSLPNNLVGHAAAFTAKVYMSQHADEKPRGLFCVHIYGRTARTTTPIQGGLVYQSWGLAIGEPFGNVEFARAATGAFSELVSYGDDRLSEVVESYGLRFSCTQNGIRGWSKSGGSNLDNHERALRAAAVDRWGDDVVARWPQLRTENAPQRLPKQTPRMVLLEGRVSELEAVVDKLCRELGVCYG